MSKVRHNLRLNPQRGISFLEVLIAIGVLTLVSIGMYATAVYTARQNVENLEHEYAIQLIESGSARVRAADFANLGATGLKSTDFEFQFTNNITTSTEPLQSSFPQYSLSYKFTGWAQVRNAASGSLTATLPTGQANWKTNEWAGHYLVIADGSAPNQMMRIISNTGNQMTVTKNLDTGTDGTWLGGAPGTGSNFYIDNGKYVDVTVSWPSIYGKKTNTISQRVLVPRV